MYELKINGKLFLRIFFGTGPLSYEKRIYRAAVSQRLRNTALETSERGGRGPLWGCHMAHCGAVTPKKKENKT